MHKHYVFGPVASRRLGISLGVDPIRRHTCTLDCVYCEAGKTEELTCCRQEFAPLEVVQNELKEVNFAENCAYIIENKFMPLPPVSSEDFKKMMGALMRYGYSFGEIKDALTLVTRGGNNE